ncbi:hypothetical protein [Brasilonema bromeliae]|nr:hypothetical protein [Brasilonema bromeliae]
MTVSAKRTNRANAQRAVMGRSLVILMLPYAAKNILAVFVLPFQSVERT